MRVIKKQLLVGLMFSALGASMFTVSTAEAAEQRLFPVIGSSSYTDDFKAPRTNCDYTPCYHNATDIIAQKGQKIIAMASGTITYVAYPQPNWGYAVFIKGDDGIDYNYLHLNNDSPGTDDGNGGAWRAYGPDMVRSYPVKRGQLIGYVGDSGNAESLAHLHFEMYKGSTPINPYNYLKTAPKTSKPFYYPELPNEKLPYGLTATAPLNVAVGSLDSIKSDLETIVAPGAGGSPQVRPSRQIKLA